MFCYQLNAVEIIALLPPREIGRDIMPKLADAAEMCGEQVRDQMPDDTVLVQIVRHLCCVTFNPAVVCGEQVPKPNAETNSAKFRHRNQTLKSNTKIKCRNQMPKGYGTRPLVPKVVLGILRYTVSGTTGGTKDGIG